MGCINIGKKTATTSYPQAVQQVFSNFGMALPKLPASITSRRGYGCDKGAAIFANNLMRQHHHEQAF
jgi:hypothetical protein